MIVCLMYDHLDMSCQKTPVIVKQYHVLSDSHFIYNYAWFKSGYNTHVGRNSRRQAISAIFQRYHIQVSVLCLPASTSPITSSLLKQICDAKQLV